jgi:hypothetical protein
MQTVDDLLDYMERTAWHTPDYSECDCVDCLTYGMVCNIYNRMQEA